MKSRLTSIQDNRKNLINQIGKYVGTKKSS